MLWRVVVEFYCLMKPDDYVAQLVVNLRAHSIEVVDPGYLHHHIGEDLIVFFEAVLHAVDDVLAFCASI
jgi:hypothetical protein